MARRRTPPRTPPQGARTSQLSAALRRVEMGADGHEYEVHPIPASRAAKTYRCPGCDHEIRSGTAHVVVWPAESPGAMDDRRHWHTPCWTNRINRGPTRRWS